MCAAHLEGNQEMQVNNVASDLNVLHKRSRDMCIVQDPLEKKNNKHSDNKHFLRHTQSYSPVSQSVTFVTFRTPRISVILSFHT